MHLSNTENSSQISTIVKSLSLEARLAQLDLALTTTIPRFLGVAPDVYFDLLRQKGTPQQVIDILENLEAYLILDDDGNFQLGQAEELLIDNSFGSIWGTCHVGSPGQNYFANQKLQEISLEKSVSKLGLLIAEEGLHGLLAHDSTIFPQAIALGASFSPELVADIGYAIGQEAVMRGVNTIFAPVLDLALDARWGRCEETFGSDPLLVSKMGAAMVRGLRRAGVAPVVKHFCGHGWVCGGRDSNDNALSIRELRRLHLPPFKEAVEAGALGIMSAYHAIDGVPCTANRFLLNEIIREEWQFRGMVVSDAGSIEDLHRKYRIVEDQKAAFELAFKAGVDLHNNGPGFKESMMSLLEEGKITEEEINRAVERILYVKDQVGLLDKNSFAQGFDQSAWLCLREKNAELAKRAAKSSLILLQNKNNILPLDPDKPHRLMILGSFAENGRALLGDYSLEDVEVPSIVDEISRYSSSSIEITYNPDFLVYSYVETGDNSFSSFSPKNTDLFICVIGEKSGFGFDTVSGEGFDRSSLELHEKQQELIRKAAETGKPVVVVVLAGRALALENITSLADAILYCCYPGEGGASAIAETIFGESSPEGNLPYDLPRRSGQVPLFYHHLPSGRGRDYCDLPGTALFPFGFGLRYTKFTLFDLEVSVIRKTPDPRVNVSVKVKNIGDRGSSVLIQIYCRDMISSVLTPDIKLVELKKEWLSPGEENKISFILGFEAFSLLDSQQKWRVEEGEFEILVGFSSQDLPLRKIIHI